MADIPITVLIADDHPALRAGLRALFDATGDIEVVGDTGRGRETVGLYTSLLPDVVILDLEMPDMSGEAVLEALLATDPGARVIVLTTYGGEAVIRRVIELGARGYLLKDTARRSLVAAVRNVHKGLRAVHGEVAERLAAALQADALTPRETDVLRSLALGQSNKAIARDLGISEATVKIHISNLLQKLDAKGRTDAVLIALQKGYIRLR